MEKTRSLKYYIVFLYMILVTAFVTSCDSQGVTYLVDITFEGGTGKAYIKSPVEVTKKGDKMTAKFIWSSKNYDYMIVNGIKYENENNGGESTFTVEIDNVTEPLTVIGDTVAMSTPHEIEYKITWGKKVKSQSSGDAEDESEKDPGADKEKASDNVSEEQVEEALEKAGLSKTESVSLKYAKCFTIDKYNDYSFVSIENSGDYLVVPEDKEVPKGLPEEVIVLKKPLDRTYLVSSSVMDLLDRVGAMDMVNLSGTKESDWYIEDARKAMADGRILYAGKYRAPDYELILENGCNLAIENTMIYHEPAVKSKLQELGIPVLVETSSYESHPLGRLEWIKLYGILYDREAEAEKYFNDQLSILEPLSSDKIETGKKVAFFHVTANGMINVRKPGDYITRMIEMAGGSYAITSVGGEDNSQSTMNMQMEDFYKEASQADIIIYNSTIGGEIKSVDELLQKNELFKDFKAVKNSEVYCTERNMFQQTTGMAEFIRDLNDIFTGTKRDYTYLYKLD